MLLNGGEIIRRKIVDDVGPKSRRAASYDLRVGTILARGNLEVTRSTEYELPPQGMVEVISLEKLTLPPNVLGYATVKTRLSDRCVLALGIGLIDPGYDSYISSTLVNFGTQPLRLERGDVFLRVTFHEYEPATENIKETHVEFEDYFQDKREKVLTRFSRTFLNLDQTASDALKVIWLKVVGISALAALVVALSTAIGSLGIVLLGARWVPPVENAQVQELRSNYVNLQAQYAATEKELEEVREAQKELQIRIDSQHQKKGTESDK
jgi:dUTPase/uncharacterized membrane protein YfbV (UPF0208 family)